MTETCFNCIHREVCFYKFRNPNVVDCSVKRTEADIITDELEKIKAEIKEMSWNIISTHHKIQKEYLEKGEIYKLLDNRTAELRGENNEKTEI